MASAVRPRGGPDPGGSRRHRRAGRARRLHLGAGAGRQAGHRHRAGVPDSADEQAYVPPLEAAGYVLRIREPHWFEHRLFKGPDTDINLHVFTVGAAEIDQMLAFRDRLRADDADRDAYLQVKRDLAGRTWRHVQHYADSKTAIVQQILARASAAGQQNQ